MVSYNDTILKLYGLYGLERDIGYVWKNVRKSEYSYLEKEPEEIIECTKAEMWKKLWPAIPIPLDWRR